MYRNVYVCGPVCVCAPQYVCVRVCVRAHKINNKLCHLNLLITRRQAGRENFLINGGDFNALAHSTHIPLAHTRTCRQHVHTHTHMSVRESERRVCGIADNTATNLHIDSRNFDVRQLPWPRLASPPLAPPVYVPVAVAIAVAVAVAFTSRRHRKMAARGESCGGISLCSPPWRWHLALSCLAVSSKSQIVKSIISVCHGT